MKFFSLFLSLLRWDVLRELRRKDTLLNMTFFAVLVLFVAQLGIGSGISLTLCEACGDKPATIHLVDVSSGAWQEIHLCRACAKDQGVTIKSYIRKESPVRASSVGPVIFWISILFAGTVGLSQTFAAEREGNTLGGIVTAPIDIGVFYLAKVAATWLYVMIMEVLALTAYSILFNFSPWARLEMILSVIAVFTLAYIASGVILAAMTTTLRGGGEVLLRILLFPLMIPLIWLTLRVSQTVFDAVIAGGDLGPPLKFRDYCAVGLAFDAIYLTAGYLLFPKVLEE